MYFMNLLLKHAVELMTGVCKKNWIVDSRRKLNLLINLTLLLISLDCMISIFLQGLQHQRPDQDNVHKNH